MKTKKIVSMLLATLMVLSAFPLAVFSVAAEGLTAPATLPDTGKEYQSDALFKDSFDVYGGMSGWKESSNLAPNASSLFNAGIDGIMFKVDATNATKEGDTIGMTFCLQVKWDGGSTYLSPTPYGAAINSGNKTVAPEGSSSTWYYSLNGETWESIEANEGTKRYANLPIGKNEAYVYIPMNHFWTKDGATVLGGGSQTAATEDALNFEAFRAIVTGQIRFSMSNFYWGGALGTDSAIKYTNFTVVYGSGEQGGNNQPGGETTEPGKAPSKLPDTNETYNSDVLFNSSLNVTPALTSWNEASALGSNVTSLMQSGVNGVMFKIDSTNATAEGVLGMTFCLQVKWDGGSTYISPTPYGAGINSSKTSVPADATSDWYISKDGGAWQKFVVNEGSKRYANLDIGKSVTYVYVPMSEFWTKDGATILGGGTQTAEKEDCVDFATFESIVGKNYKAAMSKFFWGGALGSDTAVKLSDFALVYGSGNQPGGDQPGGETTEPGKAPSKLPDTNTTYISDVLLDNSLNVTPALTGWNEAKYTGINASLLMSAGVNGVMFKIDSTNATAEGLLGLTFCLQVKWSGGSTYISPTPYGAGINSSKTSVPADATSDWYISKDGGAWQKFVVNEGSKRYANLDIGKSVTYVYVPMSEFWTKDSAAILGGGTQTAEKEDCVDFATFESIVGKEYTIAMSKFSWGGALGSDTAVKLSDFVLVYEGDPNAEPENPGEIVDNAPAKLPTTNAQYTPIMINTAYVLKGDGSSAFNRWQGGEMKISLTKDKWLTSEGFMFKFDTSKVPEANKEMMGLALQFTAGGGKQYLETDTDGTPTGNSSSYYFVTAGLLRYHNKGSYTYNGEVAKEVGLTSTWYYSIDGQNWISVTEDVSQSRCAMITNKHTVGYIFVPFEEMWCVGPGGKGLGGYNKAGTFADGIAEMTAAGSSMNIQNFGLNLQSASSGATQNLAIQRETVFSNFCFVYDGIIVEDTEEEDVILPPPAEYDTLEINPNYSFSFDPEKHINKGNYQFNFWDGETMNIAGIGEAWAGANGIMFKFDTSKVSADNQEMMGLALQFTAGSLDRYASYDKPGSPTASPTGSYFVTAGLLKYHGGSNATYKGAPAADQVLTSTWYYTTDDGATWKKVIETNAERCAMITNEHAVGYIYLPFESLWCMGPGKFGLTAYYEIGTFAEAMAMMQEDKDFNIHNFGLCLQSGSNGTIQNLAIQPETVFSDFKFVTFDTLAINSSNITVKDAIDWNVYATVPYNYTDIQMTFKIGDKTVTVKGVRDEKGKVKFTLPGVLAEQISESIECTMSVKDGSGNVREKAFTSSIADYCKRLIANDKYSAWKEATKALLHYAAAAQTKAGYQGTLANDGVDALKAPVDMSALTGTFTNGAESIWTGASLVIDGTVFLKVTVNAPTNVTAIEYTIGERSEVVSIDNGEVLISLNLYELGKDITFKCFDTNANGGEGAVTEDGALVVSANYGIANAEATEEVDIALLQAIANVGDALGAFKK